MRETNQQTMRLVCVCVLGRLRKQRNKRTAEEKEGDGMIGKNLYECRRAQITNYTFLRL